MKALIMIGLLSIYGLGSSVLPKENPAKSFLRDTLPVPREIPNLLFYLQRDPDSNTICYTLNLDRNGLLNEKDPVKIFWVRYAGDGSRKELNYLQKKYAYGITVKADGKDHFEIKSVAYPRRSLHLKKNDSDKYQVTTTINDKECALQRVFIHITGGTPISPKVEYIELQGTEFATGKAVIERVKV